MSKLTNPYTDIKDEMKEQVDQLLKNPLGIAPIKQKDHASPSLYPIVISEAFQIAFLGLFLFIVSFWPKFLSNTFLVYKFLWIKVLIEMAQHIGTWMLMWYQAKLYKIASGKVGGSIGGVVKWVIAAMIVCSIGYDVMIIIWGAIATSAKWKKAPLDTHTYRAWAITLLVTAFLDEIAAIIQGVALLWYFRKLAVIRRTAGKLWPLKKKNHGSIIFKKIRWDTSCIQPSSDFIY